MNFICWFIFVAVVDDLGVKRAFGEFDDDEDDVFGSKKVSS